ncbi:hypothetical protein K2Z83_09245 [Oscillochloris sp. ZM17-4]|nr:hypothetical protein [Oscillochloris sp. ZM17-4]MBX0327861.1 hypothetical protein [Oscillochloris sp. ZM17-4]
MTGLSYSGDCRLQIADCRLTGLSYNGFNPQSAICNLQSAMNEGRR